MPSRQPVPAPRSKIRSRLSTFLAIICFASICLWLFYPHVTEQPQPLPVRDTSRYTCTPDNPPKRVAVIGAGSAGSSAAYYLRKFAQKCPSVEITIYERSDYVGGRSTTVNAHGQSSEPVELGASIFVEVNHNIVSAVRRLGLSTQSFGARTVGDDEEESDLGVWDGANWVYYQSNDAPSWWNGIKLLWKYGMAPLRTRNLMRATVDKFLQMYSAPHFPFRDLSEKAFELGLTEVTAVTGEEYLAKNGIGDSFARDLVQASTRVNYAQNLNRIHGLETMVCMAIDGAMSVAGGNWQIFAGMIESSQASLRFNTTVTDVSFDNGTFTVISGVNVDEEPTISQYDAVILAAPYQFADISFSPKPPQPPSKIPYVTLYVTLFTSPRLLNPALFNLKATDRVPSVVLTTTSRPTKSENGQEQIKSSPSFYSISLLRTLTNPHSGQPENLYKIFSPKPLSTDYLHTLLNSSYPNPSPTAAASSPDSHTSPAQEPTVDDEIITWIYRKTWQSYPEELPRITFESTTFDLGDSSSLPCNLHSVPHRLQTPLQTSGSGSNEGKIWYTSGIESFISTMETSSLMGMNVARLLVDEWIAEQANART